MADGAEGRPVLGPEVRSGEVFCTRSPGKEGGPRILRRIRGKNREGGGEERRGGPRPGYSRIASATSKSASGPCHRAGTGPPRAYFLSEWYNYTYIGTKLPERVAATCVVWPLDSDRGEAENQN